MKNFDFILDEEFHRDKEEMVFGQVVQDEYPNQHEQV
jgi:hypothetical protein